MITSSRLRCLEISRTRLEEQTINWILDYIRNVSIFKLILSVSCRENFVSEN